MIRFGRGLSTFGLLVAILAPLLAVRVIAGPLALQNVTPSLPLGWYVRWVGRPEIGAIVAVRQPETARAYFRALGYPPDALLLKRVAARVGQPACRAGDRLLLPGRAMNVRDRDSQGDALPAWRECRRLRPGELFLLGDAAGSFDSRYFGPVSQAEVIGTYRKVSW